jgi:ABC-2 type transport system ATP-binding protein
VIDHGRVIAKGTSDELKDRIGGQRLEVRLATKEEAPIAAQALAPMGEEPPRTVGDTVILSVRRRDGLIVDAVRRLDEAGVEVDDITLRRPTLDDVFLALTGHVAESADAEQEEAA